MQTMESKLNFKKNTFSFSSIWILEACQIIQMTLILNKIRKWKFANVMSATSPFSKVVSHLKQHVASVHKHVKHFLCSKCNYATSRNGDLKKHSISVHKQESAVRWSDCDHTFSEKFNLMAHVSLVQKRELHAMIVIIYFLKKVTWSNIQR